MIFVINAGSSSSKCALYESSSLKCIWKKSFEAPLHKEKLEELLRTLPSKDLQGIGHRVVHGGMHFHKTVHITAQVKEELETVSELAPLHNLSSLEGISLAEKIFPHVPNFAVFDTAFHHTLPEEVATYPLPYVWRSKGIKRYGFHGISFAYCLSRLPSVLKQNIKELKILLCHLGSGASLCAVRDGKSIDTTMGMTPLEGLMMATRSGTIDPGLLLYLLGQGHSKEELENMINHNSGLLGISNLSGDMRLILENKETHPQAQLAYAMFIHRLRSFMGQMIASLQGLDVIVFTGGIGEHCPEVREQGCDAFSFLGLELDREKNFSVSKDEREISTPLSKVKALVISTQEDFEIARECKALLEL